MVHNNTKVKIQLLPNRKKWLDFIWNRWRKTKALKAYANSLKAKKKELSHAQAQAKSFNKAKSCSLCDTIFTSVWMDRLPQDCIGTLLARESTEGKKGKGSAELKSSHKTHTPQSLLVRKNYPKGLTLYLNCNCPMDKILKDRTAMTTPLLSTQELQR